MYDAVGVCTICAQVCHKGHSMSYAKYSSFFCDCGAENDEPERGGVYQALTARVKEQTCCQKVEKELKIRIESGLIRQQCVDCLTKLVQNFSGQLPNDQSSNLARNAGQIAAETDK